MWDRGEERSGVGYRKSKGGVGGRVGMMIGDLGLERGR